jgi:hypothetical protein
MEIHGHPVLVMNPMPRLRLHIPRDDNHHRRRHRTGMNHEVVVRVEAVEPIGVPINIHRLILIEDRRMLLHENDTMDDMLLLPVPGDHHHRTVAGDMIPRDNHHLLIIIITPIIIRILGIIARYHLHLLVRRHVLRYYIHNIIIIENLLDNLLLVVSLLLHPQCICHPNHQ